MSEKEFLEIFLANPWLFIPAFVVFVAGVTLCWFGGIAAALTALGNKRWAWGIPSIVLGPITGLPYALIYKEAEYPKSLMLKGLGLMLIAVIAVGVALLVR
ncbi:hypothetical protein [Microbulbifer magnicolonia]|uniref:hypothetical protein n=1 Tax=Microbulbifer magnicolonia TaxID=3109744 RepID=UPI002B4087F3|nr:hypothetical protein [Microbulbifer sp. GG15]